MDFFMNVTKKNESMANMKSKHKQSMMYIKKTNKQTKRQTKVASTTAHDHR